MDEVDFIFFFSFSFSIEPKNRVEKNFVIRPIRSFVDKRRRTMLDRPLLLRIRIKNFGLAHIYTHTHTQKQHLDSQFYSPIYLGADIKYI